MQTESYDCLEDRVLILPIKEEERTTTAGLIDLKKRETSRGVVTSVGTGYTARDTGVFVPTVLAKGDIVLYGVGAGLPIDVPNETGEMVEHRIMREGDVLLLIKKSSL